MRIVNVAHGSLYAYGGLRWPRPSASRSHRSRPGSPIRPCLLAAIGIGVVIGGPASSASCCGRVYGKDEVLQLLITFAVFMILDNLQRLIWGVQPIFAAAPLQLLPNITVLGVSYTSYQMLSCRASRC